MTEIYNGPSGADWANVDFGYKYSGDLDWKPGSDLHERTKARLIDLAKSSLEVMRDRYSTWKSLDETMTSYIDITSEEESVLDKDSRKPVSMVVPHSFAVLETLLTYMAAAYMQVPILRYGAQGPEDEAKAAYLEMVIAQQSRAGKMALDLHTLFRDGFLYGLGACATPWKTRRGKRTITEETPVEGLLAQFMEPRKIRREVVTFEGTTLENIDPYRFYPDPTVPIHKIQEGEFVGWLRQDTIQAMLRDEEAGDRFNVQYLKKMGDRRSAYFGQEESGRYTKFGGRGRGPGEPKYVDTLVMLVDLIPSDWRVGDSDYPEHWMFELSADQVITVAEKLDLDHGLFPVVVCAPDFDGYSSVPLGRLEVVYPLQKLLNWLINSHVANVRKSLNDMIIYDPWVLDTKKMVDSKPGKLVPTKRSMWGGDLKAAAMQLAVQDVTRQHVGDASYVIDMIQRIAATPENLMGIMRPGSERRSATEARDVNSAAMSRLEHLGRLVGLQVIYDLGLICASQTQQFMSEPVRMKVVGEWLEVLKAEYVDVNPEDIQLDYDILVGDGTTPSGSFAAEWIQLLGVAQQDPELAMRLDKGRVFQHIARLMGAKDVGRFMKKVPDQAQIQPDQMVQQGVQAGNLVPIQEAMGVAQ